MSISEVPLSKALDPQRFLQIFWKADVRIVRKMPPVFKKWHIKGATHSILCLKCKNLFPATFLPSSGCRCSPLLIKHSEMKVWVTQMLHEAHKTLNSSWTSSTVVGQWMKIWFSLFRQTQRWAVTASTCHRRPAEALRNSVISCGRHTDDDNTKNRKSPPQPHGGLGKVSVRPVSDRKPVLERLSCSAVGGRP